MRRSLRRAMWAGALAVVTAAAAVPVTAAFGAGTISAGFVATSDWGTGHEVQVTVRNGSDASIATWRIEFDLPAGTTISSFWDADVTRSGNRYTAVKKSWAGSLAPGASISWGYIGTGAYRAPTNCTVNGVSCAGGPAPTTAPPTTAPRSSRRSATGRSPASPPTTRRTHGRRRRSRSRTHPSA